MEVIEVGKASRLEISSLGQKASRPVGRRYINGILVQKSSFAYVLCVSPLYVYLLTPLPDDP